MFSLNLVRSNDGMIVGYNPVTKLYDFLLKDIDLPDRQPDRRQNRSAVVLFYAYDNVTSPRL